MKVPIRCIQCLLEEQDGQSLDNISMLEVRDDGSYQTVCSRGHQVGAALNNAKFQMLYEIGVHAICDSYYREAVGSFAAALERFYAFSCRVMALHLELLDRDWIASTRVLIGSSERELGGFVLMFLATFKAAPVTLEQRIVKLRNDVVHKGKIPTREIALQYGEAVRDVIEANLASMRSHAPRAIKYATAEISVAAFQALPTGSPQVGQTLDLVISLEGASNRIPLADEVQRCMERRQRMMAIEALGDQLIGPDPDDGREDGDQ